MLESWLRHHPVKLPSLADQAAGGQRRDTPVAAPIGQSMYLVFKAAAKEVAAASAVLTLPETGEPPTSEDLRRLEPLRGSTLLCLREEPALQYDFQEFSKLQELGVARVIFPHPYDLEAYNTIDIR